MPRTYLLLTLVTLACPACAVEDDETSLRFLPSTTGNTGGGVVFNTNEMDDIRFSELTPEVADDDPQAEQEPLAVNVPGSMMPGFVLTSLKLHKGLPLAGFAVDLGQIVGFDALNFEYQGTVLLGSEWTIAHVNKGDPKMMRLAEIVATDDGFSRYRFVHTNEDEVTASTCPTGPTGPGLARVLAGFSLNEKSGAVTHAPDTTYFACDTGATGKAADLGFYDLVADSAASDLDWKPFEAAIRAIRADYCYTGDSFTEPGTPVLIEDRWGVMPTSATPGTIEAVWGANGLLCRGKGRHTPIACDVPVPACKAKALSEYEGGLLLTRVPLGIAEVSVPPLLTVEPLSPV
jgi:hypothetical protein